MLFSDTSLTISTYAECPGYSLTEFIFTSSDNANGHLLESGAAGASDIVRNLSSLAL